MFHVKHKEYMSILIACNPKSGSGEGIVVGKKLLDHLKSLSYQVDFLQSESKEHLQSALIESACKYDLIFICGGDGTFRDSIAAIQDSNYDVPLALVPAGSGNDFAKSFGIKGELSDLAETYLKSKESLVQVTKCNEESFINVFGVGIDTAILERRLTFKRLKGSLAYLCASLITLFRYRPRLYRITLDNEVLEDRYYIITVCSGKYFGGGMMIAPDADIYSNYFQVVMMRKSGLFQLLNAFINIYKGTHVKLPYVQSYFSGTVKIELLDGEEYYNLDGDIFTEKTALYIRKDDRRLIRLKKPYLD